MRGYTERRVYPDNTVVQRILRLQANKLDAIALPAAVAALTQRGVVTLVAGDSGDIASTFVNATTKRPRFWRQTPGTAAGNLYADPADIVDGTSFRVRSDNPLDDGAVYWEVGP